MIWLLLFPSIALSELIGTREILTTNPAEGQLFRVRYNLTNTYPQQDIISPIYNITLLDPSFTRKDFLFIEGKSKAKLTFGTIKPGAFSYVDLDMEARSPLTLSLQKSTITYNFPDETSDLVELFSANTQISFTTSKNYYVQNIEYIKILAGILILGIFPILYSNYLKKKRLKVFKSN